MSEVVLGSIHYVNNAISRRTLHRQWPRRMHGRRTHGLHKTGHTGIASLTLVSDSSLHRRWKFTHPQHLSLSSLSFHWQQGLCPMGYPFTANPLTPASQMAGAWRGALGATSASPFKGQKIKIIELYTYGYRPCKRTRSQASQGSLPTLSSS